LQTHNCTHKPIARQNAGVVQHSDLGRKGGGRDVYVGNTALTLKRDYMEVRC
jgi:hypothetical protein